MSRRINESQQSLNETVSNKVEIDQDNIETPPATRRIFTTTPTTNNESNPCRRLVHRSSRDSLVSPSDEPELNTTLGDGQFDRFSSARRTRRYKRNTENTTEQPQESVTVESHSVKTQPEVSKPINTDREERLQAWKEKLNAHSSDQENQRPGKRYRNQTGVNRDDIELALQLNNTKKNISTTYIANNKLESNKIDIPLKKGKEHDNDEGFEETQSLMSESPSQGASSGGGNYETDIVDGAQIVVADYSKTKPKRTILDSKTAVTNKCNETTNMKKTTNTQLVQPKFSRTSSLRQPSTSLETKRSIVPRRTESLRKSDSKTSITGAPTTKNVQRSNSKNSLMSSRSSLNSSTSTSTVKRLPLKPNNANTRQVQRTTSSKSINNQMNGKSSLRRSPSSGSTTSTTIARPPRPAAMSFMKPTTSSSTKMNTTVVNRPSFRSKN